MKTEEGRNGLVASTERPFIVFFAIPIPRHTPVDMLQVKGSTIRRENRLSVYPAQRC